MRTRPKLLRLWRWLVRASYFCVYGLVASGLYVSLAHYLDAQQYAPLAAVCGAVVVALFAFASLQYNRARALPHGPSQRRSLYAAERTVQAAVLFIMGAAVGGIGAGMGWAVPGIAKGSAHPVLLGLAAACYLISLLLLLAAFACFYMAFEAVARKLLRWQTVRQVVRRIR